MKALLVFDYYETCLPKLYHYIRFFVQFVNESGIGGYYPTEMTETG